MRSRCPSRRWCRRASDQFVFKVSDGKAVLTKVKVGIRRDGHGRDRLEGLGPDDEVVTAGQLKISDGAEVKPVPKSGGLSRCSCPSSRSAARCSRP